MRTSSRLMPKYKPQSFGVAGWFVLSAVACSGFYVLWTHPIASVFAIGLFLSVCAYEHIKTKVHFNGLMNQRAGESLCTFARAQDLTDIDTLIVRAVYEELQLEIVSQKDFPLRWSDNLYSDLRLQGDDIEDLIERVAQRTGRCIKHTALNPLFGNIHTVSDLIAFLNHQPISKDRTGLNNQSEEI